MHMYICVTVHVYSVCANVYKYESRDTTYMYCIAGYFRGVPFFVTFLVHLQVMKFPPINFMITLYNMQC